MLAGEVAIGMELQVVPQIFVEEDDIFFYYSLERPGPAWSKGDSS